MFDNIVLFTQLVEIGNYVKTAEYLNISAPTLTRRIQDLERGCGCLLLLRDTRNVSLTERGELLYQEYKDLRQRLNIFYHNVNSTEYNNTGELNVILPLIRSMELVSPYISYFASENPDVKLNLFYQHGDISHIDDYIDIAITSIKIQDDKRNCKLLRTEYIQLYCTPEYARKYGIPLSITELQDHNFIGGISMDKNPIDYVVFTNQYTKENIVYNSTKDRLKVSTPLHALEVGLQSEFIFPCWNHMCEKRVSHGELVQVLPEYFIYQDGHYLTTRKQLRAEEQTFVDFIYRCMNRIMFVEDVIS